MIGNHFRPFTKRISEMIGDGQVTMCYSHRNEIGYSFCTYNSEIEQVDYDGIPLVLCPLNNILNKSDDVFNTEHKCNMIVSKTAEQANSTCSSNILVHPREIHTKNVADLVFFDLETTGLNAELDQIIEIGAIKISNGQEYDFHRLIRINFSIPEIVRNMTKITDDMLSSGTDLESSVRDFQKFIKDSVLVGYNLSFDIKFLNKAFDKFSLDHIKNKTKDLMYKAKKMNSSQVNYKFETTLNFYGIESSVSHRALEDAKLMHLLFQKMY